MGHLRVVQDHQKAENEKAGLRALRKREDKEKNVNSQVLGRSQPDDGKTLESVEQVLLKQAQGKENQSHGSVLAHFMKHGLS
jgi:hypothetical protein